MQIYPYQITQRLKWEIIENKGESKSKLFIQPK